MCGVVWSALFLWCMCVCCVCVVLVLCVCGWCCVLYVCVVLVLCVVCFSDSFLVTSRILSSILALFIPLDPSLSHKQTVICCLQYHTVAGTKEQYSTVQCSVVRCGTEQNSAVQHSAAHYSTIQCGAARYELNRIND